MSTILHLSDLHLGDKDAWERRTDDKTGEIVPSDENTRQAVLKTALSAAKRHLAQAGTPVDVVAVTGDLTSQHAPEGFERFRQILTEADLVAPDQVLVVPGNHDVDWAADPSTPEKYVQFLEHTRKAGMRTPLCDGVDLPTSGTDPAQPILALDDCLLVAINSANWCGVTIGSGTEAQTFDIARVSEAQLEKLSDELRDYEPFDGVRIAMLHHHLLPVTEDEEVKPFESFTNLARLRAWLQAHRFHVVLHGHKHSSVLTWDHIYDLGGYQESARRILLTSAPTPTTWGSPVFRVIKVGNATGRAPVRHAPRIVVDTVQAERHERPVIPEALSIPLDEGRQDPPGLLAIDAETADAAYEQLVHALEQAPRHLLNVTCVVREPESAERLPTNFAGQIDHPETWLRDAVDWWQKAAPALVAEGAAPFNHGERLYSTGPEPGALVQAAERLGSTTAMVLLVANHELQPGGKSPAFVAVQLVRAGDEKGDRLDCVGYFRKQDLTLWWPVNVAELREIQRRVLDLESVEGIRPGRLVTISVEAIHDEYLPQLAGTRVDRLVDLRPSDIIQLAYSAAHGSDEHRDTINKQWKDVLGDIGSPHTRDFPSLGVRELIEHLRLFESLGAPNNIAVLIKRLERVYDRAHRARTESKTKSATQKYGKELFALMTEVLDAVDTAIGGGDPPQG